jgi:hypothetical protein
MTTQEPIKTDELDPAEIELNEHTRAVVQETQTSLKEFEAQLSKLIEFNEEQLKRGEINYATVGKSRVDALKNFHAIEEEVKKTRDKIKELLAELKQKMPAATKTAGASMNMNHSAQVADEEDN